MARAQAPCLRIGAEYKSHTFGEYTVCLTDNQWKKLFSRRPPKQVGCGVFACAYDDPTDPTKVVKITRDETDVSALVAAQKLLPSRVPRLYGAYRLPQGGHNKTREHTDTYAVRLERLGQLPRQVWRNSVMKAAKDYDSPEAQHRQMLKVCPRGNRACRTFADELFAVTRTLRTHGIDWFDIHTGNIGLGTDGKWKIMDLGLSSHRRSIPKEVLTDAIRGMHKALPYRRR